MVKLSLLLFLHCMVSPLLAYRDGARENSCYDHSIEHGAGTETFPCVPPSCPFFLRIKEVVNEDTLELSNETVSTYECDKIYGIELATSLNDPEGFLIQARSGTDVSSEIIGTFLDPDVVRVRNPTVEVNYKTLSCNGSMESMGPLLPNSATHPTTVDEANILQLYWQAPNCSTCGLGNLRIWFTAVQQLQIVFTTSKVTELQLQNYFEPEECIPTTTPPTTTLPPTTTSMAEPDAVEPALSTVAKIGIGVGVAGGAIVLIILAIVIVFVLCLLLKLSHRGDTKKSNWIETTEKSAGDTKTTDKSAGNI